MLKRDHTFPKSSLAVRALVVAFTLVGCSRTNAPNVEPTNNAQPLANKAAGMQGEGPKKNIKVVRADKSWLLTDESLDSFSIRKGRDGAMRPVLEKTAQTPF